VEAPAPIGGGRRKDTRQTYVRNGSFLGSREYGLGMTIALHYEEAGEGLPVVLLHAFPLSSAMWSAQRDELAPRYRVITPDQRGFGGTPLGGDPASLAKPSLATVADDLVRFLDRLSLDQVVVAGLSMGGYVAMALLRRHPERVRALILANSKASADPEAAAANRERIAAAVLAAGSSELLLDEVYPKLLGPSARPEVAAAVRDQVRQAPPAAVAWAQRAMAARPDSLDVLRSVTVPALVVAGEDDQLMPLAEAESMADALPKGRLVRIPGAGHLSALEDPAAFNAAVSEFLAEI
jgi:pimeloyl-ACP methyl ester carboxylesterase